MYLGRHRRKEGIRLAWFLFFFLKILAYSATVLKHRHQIEQVTLISINNDYHFLLSQIVKFKMSIYGNTLSENSTFFI